MTTEPRRPATSRRTKRRAADGAPASPGDGGAAKADDGTPANGRGGGPAKAGGGGPAGRAARDPSMRSIGSTLRARRRARGLSLADVAEATQISASFLSLVENGRSDITIARLSRLVDFYGISITDLLPGPAAAEPDVVRAAERRLIHSPAEGIDVFLLGPDTRRSMMPMLVVFQPGASLAEYGSHPGEEFVHVLSGCLELTLMDSPPRLLRAGDSAYYPSDRSHLFANASEHETLEVVCVDSPPNL
jgi:transcriptional regulator with XRE-family HTH domain